VSDFVTLYGREPAVEASAPGRVNLIGEHTDYNGGLVLPLAIARRTRVELDRRRDERVRAVSVGFAEAPREYRLGEETPGGGWLDYVQGVTATARAAGHPLAGVDLRIESTVPAGAGLSSSAALEVALLRALRRAFELPLDDVAVAQLAWRAETEFVGAPVGVMDQMAASLGAVDAAVLLDAATLAWSRVTLPSSVAVIPVDSGVRHRHAGGEYAMRRAECERAAAALGAARLCDVPLAALDRVASLPPPLDRRARHVLTENARVGDFVRALGGGDLARCGALLYASHASLRDDFEVSIPAIDTLVELARRQPAIYGARLTGGGFGGAIVVLARAADAKTAIDALVSDAQRAGVAALAIR
jgi:galactokinase